MWPLLRSSPPLKYHQVVVRLESSRFQNLDPNRVLHICSSIYWVLLFQTKSRPFIFATKPLSQKHRSTFLPLQDATGPDALLRWIRV